MRLGSRKDVFKYSASEVKAVSGGGGSTHTAGLLLLLLLLLPDPLGAHPERFEKEWRGRCKEKCWMLHFAECDLDFSVGVEERF